jgi:CubicO group peptidase (beta-lactamase class C family)
MQITVRQLLYQTSGFYEIDGEKLNFASSMKQLTSTESIDAPGSAFEYSN